MAGNEPVTSPDQHKPSSVKLARLGGIITIVALLAMLLGNHTGWVENLWLIVSAGVIAALLIGDWLLRKNGLNSD